MSTLRQAMQAVDDDPPESYERVAQEAIGRALTIENKFEGAAEASLTEAKQREDERQAREDELASLAMEIVMRARQRIGRTKWSTTEGVVKRRIMEALRCLAPDD
jgi:hypothetical protein